VEKAPVVTNAYQLDVREAAEQIFKYELKFYKAVQKKGSEELEEREVSRG